MATNTIACKDSNTATADERARAALLAALERDVAELVKHDDMDGLDDTLANTGYMSNWTSHTCEDLGRGIMALAPLLDVDDLACVVHTAAWHRHRGPSSMAERARAESLANATLAEVGPDILERFLERTNTLLSLDKDEAGEVH